MHRLLIGAGGTAGHLTPAHELARRLLKRTSPPKLLFTGGKLSTNRFFNRSFPYRDLPAATFSLRRPLKAAIASWGVCQAVRLIRSYRPDLVVGFGSFHTFPLLMAAKLCRVPFVLHEGNAYPGKVTRFFSSSAALTALQFEGASHHLKGPCLPVEIARTAHPQGEIEVEEGLFTLLIFGGSQGATRLNKITANTLIEFAEHMQGLQVIHLTGDGSICQSLQEKYAKSGIKGYVAPYESRMDLAWRAADLAICRAGAASCSEQIAFGVPAIMVPYPYATDRHQDHNAQALVDRGVIKMDEAELSKETLLSTLIDLIGNQRAKLRVMKKACGPREGPDFAEVVAEVAGWE